VRIVQVANFVAPHSGGIRTVLNNLAAGYRDHGHDVVQIIPGAVPASTATSWGFREVIRAWPVPGSGYRLMNPAAVCRAIMAAGADRIEVHDRTTLRGLGTWAAWRDIHTLVVSHERLDRLVRQWLPDRVGARPAISTWVDRDNAALARRFNAVVCTTEWAATEFRRLPGADVRIVPLGVDADRFVPGNADPDTRESLRRTGEVLVVLASRLSREKLPALAVLTVDALTRRGVRTRLVVAGDGPQRSQLQALAARLNVAVRFLGHVPQRELARWLASADVVLAPGPVETFCLAALEALASGTPVVCNSSSAVPEILGSAGVAATGEPEAWAVAVEDLLGRPESQRRAAARQRALRYGWGITVRGMLVAHSCPVPANRPLD
jgi:alpha-1,6-mannosyltransferase